MSTLTSLYMREPGAGRGGGEHVRLGARQEARLSASAADATGVNKHTCLSAHKHAYVHLRNMLANMSCHSNLPGDVDVTSTKI